MAHLVQGGTIAQAIGEYQSKQLITAGMHPTQLAGRKGGKSLIATSGTRTKGEGAVFKRILKTTHTLLGSKIIDIGVSDIFADVYDGQATFFPIFERAPNGDTLNVGEISIGNTPGGCDYLIETPVHRKPLFGSGEFFGLDLNIYHDNIDFNQDNTLTDIEVYKFKRGLGTVGTFGAARVDSFGDSNVMIGSMSYNDGADILENFNGIDPIQVKSAIASNLSKHQLSGTVVPVGTLYMSLDDAWRTAKPSSEEYGTNYVDRVGGVLCKSKTEFKERYVEADTYNGTWIIHLERVLWGKWWQPAKGTKLHRDDPAWKRTAFDYYYDEEQLTEDFQEQLFLTKGDESILIPKLKPGEQWIAPITTDDTIFKEIFATGDISTTSEEEEGTRYPAYTRSYFSNENSPPSGSSWKQELWWSHALDKETLSFAGQAQEYQTSMAWLRLPKPLRISRLDKASLGDDNDYQADCMEVDIKFSIPEMNKYHRSDEQVPGSAAYGHNLLRSFMVIAATRPPREESLHTYLSNLTGTTDAATPKGDNPYLLEEAGGTSATATRKNNMNAVAFIRQSITENSTGRQDGPIRIHFSGASGSRANYISGNDAQKLPYIAKTGAGAIGTLSYAGQSEMSPNEYYTLKMIFNYRNAGSSHGGAGKDGITWVLLDSDKKIMASRKAGHGGNTPTAAELNTNAGAGFPSYLSFWVNNAKVGIQNEQSGTDGLYSDEARDSRVTVVIDNISISGFEGENQNVSITSINQKSSRPMIINAETTRNLIDTEGTFDKGEEIPTLMVTDEKSPIANYIMWGTKSDILSGNINNIFMGGMTSGVPSLNTACTFSGGTGLPTTSDIILIVPDNAGKLGSWNVLDRNVTCQADPHHNDALTLTGINYVDTFTKKGFFTIDFLSVTNPANYVARECPAFSTKITRIVSEQRGEISVANPGVLMGNNDEEYIIYRAGQTYGTDMYRTGITIKNNDVGTEIIKLQGGSGTNAYKADDGSTLLTDAYLHELYISPKRFWFGLEIFSVDATSNEFLPQKTYTYSLIQQGIPPGSTTKGMTFNEELYSDTTGNSNRWNIDKSGGLVETAIDFGYGARSEDDNTVDFEVSSGYIQKYVPKLGYNAISLDGLINVDGSRLNKPDEKINLFVSAAPEADGSCAIRTTKYTGTDSNPFFTFYYYDERPIITDFNVIPYEDDPFYPYFTWDTQDEDLWYGFLLFSNKEIKNQYDGAVAHIPLNETNVYINQNIKLYRYDGTYSGTVVDGVTGGGTSNITSVEGLSGNAFKGNGGTSDSWVAFGDAGASTWTRPINELSVIAHFTCDSLAASRYVLSKLNEFEIYIDTNGNINTLVKPQGGTAVTLKSTSIVSTDGETPMNAIITFDRSLATGNVKLFINGKLEDQSGQKLATGTTSNWHDANLNNDASVLTVGARGTSSIPSGNYHSGTIEEVVIYNKCIYPVVPQTGEFTLYKPYAELQPEGNPQSGITNVTRLFVKDYHNIRGTSSNQVTASSMISWRKSGLGLKSI